MTKLGFGQRVKELLKFRKAVIDLCPRKADGEIGQPYKTWIKVLDVQIDQARLWLGTHKPPPPSDQGAGEGQGQGELPPGCPDGRTLQEKPSDLALSASLCSNKVFSEAIQDQPPQPPDQLLPLLCRVLLLK